MSSTPWITHNIHSLILFDGKLTVPIFNYLSLEAKLILSNSHREQLKASFQLHIVLNPGGFTHGSQVGTLVEDIVVDLELAGLEIDLTTAIGLDGDVLLDSIIANLAKDPINCILPAFKGLIISDLRLSLDDIVGPKLTGFICPGLDNFVNNARLVPRVNVYLCIVTSC